MPSKAASGDAIPANCALIELRDRDLDPNAEQFIESWAKELPRGAPLALLVYLDRPSGSDDGVVLRDSVHQFFGRSADAARRRLRGLRCGVP